MRAIFFLRGWLVVWAIGLAGCASGGRSPVTLTSAPAAFTEPARVLEATGIGALHFEAGPAAVRRAIDSLLGQAGGGYAPSGGCGVDHQITWWDRSTAARRPDFTAYFHRSKFVGYQAGQLSAPRSASRARNLATARGLRVGDTLARGRRLYGDAFVMSAAQGGSWSVRLTHGVLTGYAWGVPKTGGDVSWHSVVATIDAGNVGCAAVSP